MTEKKSIKVTEGYLLIKVCKLNVINGEIIWLIIKLTKRDTTGQVHYFLHLNVFI